MNKLRLVFAKGERTRYVGHLDILRTFIRALRRAEVPIKYSEGFNPHAIMTFALPLGVSVTSECEMVDITMREPMSAEEVISKVNANFLPDSLRVLSGEYTDAHVPEIERAEYIIRIVTERNIDVAAIEKALASDEILVEKKSKKKISEINIMEHIFESEIADSGDNFVEIRAIISAGNTFNIKPQLVVAAIEKAVPDIAVSYSQPHRKRFITKNEV